MIVGKRPVWQGYLQGTRCKGALYILRSGFAFERRPQSLRVIIKNLETVGVDGVSDVSLLSFGRV